MGTRCILAGVIMAAAGFAQDQVRLGLFTAMPEKWNVEANWRVFAETVERHAGDKPDVIVTPECFLDGYAAAAKDWTPEKFAAVAQDEATSPYIAKVRELAEKHRTAILFG
jgi:predicted amidohydrolase